MKTLEAKPFDQNAENWKRENRMFISTVLEARRLGAKIESVRTHWEVIEPFDSFSLLKPFCFLLETDIAGHERLFLAKWHPKA